MLYNWMKENPLFRKCSNQSCGMFYSTDDLKRILDEKCDIEDIDTLYCIKCKDRMIKSKLVKSNQNKPPEHLTFNIRRISEEKNTTDLYVKLTSEEIRSAP